jgi:hypothetical protein
MTTTIPILSEAEYPAVRAAIDVSLTEAQLPNEIIGLSIYQDAAIRDVYNAYAAAGSSDDPADETDEDNIARITRAAVYYCAARLCPAVVRITSLNVTTRDLSYSRQTFDPEKRAAELVALAEAELAEILQPSEETPYRPTMFTTASGMRGL